MGVGWDGARRRGSINQLFAGTVSGEWHNNHHLYPGGARSGFFWWQLDTAWAHKARNGVSAWSRSPPWCPPDQFAQRGLLFTANFPC
jgi:hypothetical protein